MVSLAWLHPIISQRRALGVILETFSGMPDLGQERKAT